MEKKMEQGCVPTMYFIGQIQKIDLGQEGAHEAALGRHAGIASCVYCMDTAAWD